MPASKIRLNHTISEMPGATSKTARRQRFTGITIVAFLLVLAMAGCERSGSAQAGLPSSFATSATAGSTPHATPSSYRDLSSDEVLGGHTLARHVGKTDDELRERLRLEPQISTASTYTDRATAEAVIGAALSSPGRSFDAWRKRTGRRPNFVLRFAAGRIIGRSLARGRVAAVFCENALVVLRWDDRRAQFYVLTSYPEDRR